MPPRARACRLPCAQVRRAASAMNESPARGFRLPAISVHHATSAKAGEALPRTAIAGTRPGNPRPAAIGKRGFPVSRFPPFGNRGPGPRFPFCRMGIGVSSRFPAKSGIGGTGIGDVGLWPTELARSHWQPPLTCVGGWNLKSAFSRIKGSIWPVPRIVFGTHMG